MHSNVAQTFVPAIPQQATDKNVCVTLPIRG